MSEPPSLPSVSVIIPIWNDAVQLRAVLDVLTKIDGILEIIVGDASDGPECAAIARHAGAIVVQCPEPSRGKQMNAAAAIARGDVLLFQHADTEISEAHIDSLRRTMADESIVGGGYYRRFNPHHRSRRWMEPIIRKINSWSTIWGDQSMFIRRNHFEKLGGFKPIPLFEDADLSKRLRRSGKVMLIDPPMWSSARRHKAYGSWRASVEIFTVVQLYRLGVSPFWLHKQYYRRNKKGRQGPPVESGIATE
jgi:rSAM/selenodomain-associated transferase 2